jgi:hypothetical protein
MLHVFQHGQRIRDNGMRFASFDISYKANPTGVMLKRRMIQASVARHTQFLILDNLYLVPNLRVKPLKASNAIKILKQGGFQ